MKVAMAAQGLEDDLSELGDNDLQFHDEAVKKATDIEKMRQKSSAKTVGTSQDAAETKGGEFSKANDDNVHEKVASEQLGLFKIGLDLSAESATAETMGSLDSQQSFGPYGPVTQVHDKATGDTGRNNERSPSTSILIEVYEQPLPSIKSIHNGTIGAAFCDRDMHDALDGKMKSIINRNRVICVQPPQKVNSVPTLSSNEVWDFLNKFGVEEELNVEVYKQRIEAMEHKDA
ncbi:hypothetical protein Ancab_005876 [Ancistrocladus abbreviatus]